MSNETSNETAPQAARNDQPVTTARPLPPVDPQRLRDDIDSIVDQSL